MQVRAVLIFLAVRLRYGRDDVALLYFVAGFQPFFRLYIFVDCLYSVAVIDDNLRTYKTSVPAAAEKSTPVCS